MLRRELKRRLFGTAAPVRAGRYELERRIGDATAGEELFDRYFASMTRFFRNKAEHAMDDLIQQTFVAVLEGRERFRGDGTFRSFLFGAAYNVLREHYRGRRRAEERIDFAVSSVHDLAPRPSEVLAQRRDERLLLEALRRVPVEHQVLLELYFWEPLPAPRIAEILGIPEGTVRTRLRRAKTLLAEQLQQLAPGSADLDTTLTHIDDWARALRDRAGD